MPNIDVNGQIIDYPDTGDTNWGDNATNFAIQTSSALGKLGLDTGTSVDIPQTLDVTGNTTLDANLSVAGTTSLTGDVTLTNNLTVNGNTSLGNANTDTTTVTGIVNVNSGVLYVDPVHNRVGINDTTPSQALDVTGDVAITGNGTIGGTLGVTGDVAINTNKFNVTASSGNTTIAGTLGVTGNTTVDGVIYADDSTTANTPVISFTGDTNTGIGRSGADTLDLITNGNSRFRIESTGQLQAVISGNTTFYPGFLCRAWVNFNGTGTTGANQTIRGSGNVSSVLKNGTGDYTVNIDTDMPDGNYATTTDCAINATGNAGSQNGDLYVNSQVAGSYRILTANTGTFTDMAVVTSAVFR